MPYDIWRPLHFALLVFLFLFVLGSSGASHAQTTVDPDKAKAFVQAAIVISLVSGTWEPKINRATSEAETDRLREQANSAIREAIGEIDGMTVHRYRSMYYEAKQNPELAAYLSDLLEQEVAGR